MAADVLTRVRAEIEARLRELRPAATEYQRLLEAADAIDAEARERSAAAPSPAAKPKHAAEPRPAARLTPAAKPTRASKPGRKPAAKRQSGSAKAAALGAAEHAILAALEHGSHTVAELVVVTAMSGGEIREGARLLLRSGRIVRAKREGRAAYALADAA